MATALAAGTGLKVAGALQEGRAEGQAADFNARVARQQARGERDNAAAEASDYRRGEMRKLSASRTARLATGVTMAGSPLLVDEATVREVALGSSRIAHGGTVRGMRLDQDAMLSKMQGKAARTASYYKAGTSLLNGATSWAGTQ